MASNYTSNYGLCQWQASDKVLRTEFNADNAKIDAALAGKASTSSLNSLKTTVNGKASQSALDSLTATVNGLKTSKADKSALDSLSSTVSGHTSALAKKGNCTIYTTTYTGNGKYGSANPRTLTLPAKPVVVIIGGAAGLLVMVQGARETSAPLGSGAASNTLSWSGNSVTWYHNGSSDASGMMNESGVTYYVVALMKAD